MKIAADFEKREVVHSESLGWIKSPMAGVDRRPLDRIGGEVARATTIVRYAPGSHFSSHVHTGGEEFIVLDGVFQDEHGDFPVGSYVRNPPQSSHTPGSEDGCVIFVKLWQYQPEDRKHVKLRMDAMGSVPDQNNPGISVTPLFKDDYEEVSLLHFAPNATVSIECPEGAELFVLNGDIRESEDTLVKHSWLRTPIGTAIKATAGEEGAKVWIKSGNLTEVQKQLARVENA
ncbi:cupin domain-containing protein [Alteromonas sp. 5E99-2]|uniref:cupin domain-containing protein n=1 Tax=Alteromonas sp. 5E99-2 TaxID=2817683 RepID=UPI001A9966D2|nr:cupin domain-containing protein [Alteromonas sp. 5E99-2]MBO1254761.1 cupin domain-containing protein [Alteromonas sp. 5E99-2]